MKVTVTFASSVVLAAAVAVLPACEEKKPADTASTPAKADNDGPGGDDHAHEAGHGGAVIALGEQTIGAFSAKATRDEGQIVAGKDAPIDVTVTPVAGATVRAVAVRFWIGTEDAKGSVKARAEIENPAEPNRWHTHAEVPSPLPSESRLWVEIEDDQGQRHTTSFGLRTAG